MLIPFLCVMVTVALSFYCLFGVCLRLWFVSINQVVLVLIPFPCVMVTVALSFYCLFEYVYDYGL